jgi:hypothetical protein
MIYIYLAIGLTIFFVLQFVSRMTLTDSDGYGALKVSAWLSAIIWPLVVFFWVSALFFFGACRTIEYLDERIDRIIRRKK